MPGSAALLLSEKGLSRGRRRAPGARPIISPRLGQAVEILPVSGGHWRVKYPLPAEPPLVSLIIPTRNGRPLLERCDTSILAETLYPRFEILVVDNGSDDPATLAYLATLADGSHPAFPPATPRGSCGMMRRSITRPSIISRCARPTGTRSASSTTISR